MPGNAQPLVGNQPIVNSDGTPNAYFTKWAQQRQIDITSGITADQAQEIAQEFIDTWAAMRQIIAGTGLDGGGDLSNDVTLDLADTAVSPGTYGDATNSAQITVDQQGRITNVVDVPITGGGGGGGQIFITLNGGNLAASTATDKYKGAIVVPECDITLTDTYARGTVVAAQTYVSVICTINTSNVITGLIATSNQTTIAVTNTDGTIRTTFPSPVTLTTGTRYALLTTRTDGGGALAFTGVFWADSSGLSSGAPLLYISGVRGTAIAIGTTMSIPGNIYCQSILGTPTF